MTTTEAGAGPDLQGLARESGLTQVGLRPPLGDYVRQLWGRRDFIVTFARSGVAAGIARDRLGVLWLVLTPLLLGGVYWAVFGVILGTRGGITQFVGYLTVGIFVFQFLARMVVEGSKAVQGNLRLVQALSFPRASLPLAVWLRQLITFLPAIAVMIVVVVIDPEFERLTWYALLLPPALLLASLFGLGLVFLLARAVTHFNDVSNLLPFSLRIWLYTSGVFYSFERLAGGNETLVTILQNNPMHIYLTLARDSLVYGQASPGWYWWSAGAWAVGLPLVGFLLFWQAEERYTRDD